MFVLDLIFYYHHFEIRVFHLNDSVQYLHLSEYYCQILTVDYDSDGDGDCDGDGDGDCDGDGDGDE